MTAPTVSVIMPVYNGAALIGETLASLRAQTFTDFEIVIVDDCSTDDTVAIVREVGDTRIILIESPANQGPVRARNRALAEAQGRYIAALDADDLCRPERLAAQVAYLDANRDTVLVGTAASILEEGALSPGRLAARTTPDLIAWLCRIENPLVWSSVMMRADAARQLAPFTRPEMVYAEDFDLYHRIATFGALARLDDELVIYREHQGGISKQHHHAMVACTTTILAADYATLFGDEATEIAALMVRHMMIRHPVPDAQTFQRLGAAIVRLQQDFITQWQPAADSLHLIRRETAQRWARIGRTALRTGTINLANARAALPDHADLPRPGARDLALSSMIGSLRAIVRKRVVAPR